MASQKKKSRQRSSTKRPHRPYTFFVDADLGRGFHRLIANDDRFIAVCHEDHFDEGTEDQIWIAEVARRGWIAISHDGKIRSHHKPIVREAGARIIIAVGQWKPAEHAENFIRTFPRIQRFVAKRSGAYMARLKQPTPSERAKKINPRGTIVLWGDW